MNSAKMNRPISLRNDSYRSLSFTLIKWILVSFALFNILSSIWVGIYLEKAVNQAAEEIADADGNYTNGDRSKSAKIWKGFIIAILVIIDLVNLMGIFGALKEHYFLVMVYGVLLMTYAIFAAGVDYTRGSISSWLIPFMAAILAFVFAHKIRVEIAQPTVYTSPANA
jgi:hypothetical protein